jgi:hypothetical protein
METMISLARRAVQTLSNHLLVLLVATAATLATASAARAATITVTTTADETVTNDAPSVSLREAIISINNQADTGADVTANRVGPYGANDTINFNIPGSGVKTIFLGSSLPTITRSLTINGATQGTAVQGQPPLIALDGTGAGTAVNGLTAVTAVTIEGLDIGNFSANAGGVGGVGVLFSSGSDGSTLKASYIGTNPAGTASAPNAVGVQVGGSTQDANTITIGGFTASARNVISGNAGPGISTVGGRNISIVGDFIGTNGTGSNAIPNRVGVQIATPDAAVGGTTAGSGNVISGNGGAGIMVLPGALRTMILGNLVGTGTTGSTAVGNSIGISLGATGTQVGGSVAASRNVVSGNSGSGLLITGASNSVLGNFIGVNSADGAKLGNGGDGILVTAAGTAGNTVGGVGGNRNVISGNGANGVFLNGSTSNVVAQNFIGTDLGATLSLGNGSAGVRLAGAKSNQIGGTPSQQAVIANNGDYGINAGTNGNVFQQVLIYNNATGTILVAAGPTPTATTTLSADRRTISLNASGLTPGQPFSYELYATDAKCGLRSLLGYGGGGADAFGAGTGSLTLGAPLPAGSNVGALVTDGGSLGTSPTQGCPTRVIATPVIATPPVVAGATESNRTWRESNRLATFTKKKAPIGTTFSFRLNEQARVTFAFARKVPGRKVNGRCVTPVNKNKHKPKCTHTVAAGTLSFAGHSGTNKVSLQGRISRSKKLPLGRYTLRISATNAAGRNSNTQTLDFTIVK